MVATIIRFVVVFIGSQSALARLAALRADCGVKLGLSALSPQSRISFFEVVMYVSHARRSQ